MGLRVAGIIHDVELGESLEGIAGPCRFLHHPYPPVVYSHTSPASLLSPSSFHFL